ncbi:biotin--[acetyl-CoA-carboxylase] ligase [Acrocarpospora corrugata]|uniref:biotin--[biotin carboxyl-carrier protein] ligase n=1 Tax=Acrocarpospora corrugata TaxID=35763 RepID=A0A5M3W4U8_9ACTN|nr:biotin--[acetyl-CoA-carboxylase] ligase [Acrocarpospora corrugata]GES03280.1 biotin--[acetyl-CoA-carboxylase] ligase [Acrocarpospora corrugata]
MPDSPFLDLDRPPLSQAALQSALVRPGSLWSAVKVVERTGSTNADLANAARENIREGAILVAESQFAGRGRLGRSWTAPPRSGLTFSVLLRPDVPTARQGWLPLLFGLAAATGVRAHTGVDVRLKWPNDLLVGERKLAGVLAERVDSAVVVGMGLNVTMRQEELPVDRATSLLLAGAPSLNRGELLIAVLRELEARYREWVDANGDVEACGSRAAYLAGSATVGREVRVELPGERVLIGEATGIDRAGYLVVRSEGTDHKLSVGDVVHVRPANP